MATAKETRERLTSADERWYALDQAEVPGRLGVVLDSGLSADEAAETQAYGDMALTSPH
jgi:hypothetical protein